MISLAPPRRSYPSPLPSSQVRVAYRGNHRDQVCDPEGHQEVGDLQVASQASGWRHLHQLCSAMEVFHRWAESWIIRTSPYMLLFLGLLLLLLSSFLFHYPFSLPQNHIAFFFLIILLFLLFFPATTTSQFSSSLFLPGLPASLQSLISSYLYLLLISPSLLQQLHISFFQAVTFCPLLFLKAISHVSTRNIWY